MKKILSYIISTKRTLAGTRRSKRTWIVATAVFGGLAIGFAAWSQAQSANSRAPVSVPAQATDHEPPMTPARELSLRAILQPVEFEAEISKRKNQQDILDEQIAILAISQAAFYSAEFEAFKGPERRDAEVRARNAVLDPVTHSGPVQALRDALRSKKERGEEQTDPILNLSLESANIPGVPVQKEPVPKEARRLNLGL